VLKNVFFGAALIWTIVIACLCLVSFNHFPKMGLSNSDKYAHFAFYFVFSGLWFLYFSHRKDSFNRVRTVLVVFFLSLFYGVAIEMMQYLFTDTRKADVFDVLANAFGAVIGLLVIVSYQKYLQKIKLRNNI
jgi:VanZ family protein